MSHKCIIIRIKNKIKRCISKLDRWYNITFFYERVKKENQNLKILDNWSSVNYILNNKCSLSRYGDGEFQVMLGGGNKFQRPNKQLSTRLKEILLADDADNFVVGIPIMIKSLDGIHHADAWWPYFTAKFRGIFRTYLKTNKVYLNTNFTRFYHDLEDKSKCGEYISFIKKIWDNKDVVIIEGELTRSGVGNDLYNNAHSVKRILGPAINAFDMYNQMLEAVIKYVDKDKLILLSYGMTATVLAYDLCMLGYWAIDIGHLDIEYEWFKKGAKEKVAVKGKFTNEAINGNIVEDCLDPLYLSQIICNITNY